jgi:hypothetical protein
MKSEERRTKNEEQRTRRDAPSSRQRPISPAARPGPVVRRTGPRLPRPPRLDNGCGNRYYFGREESHRLNMWLELVVLTGTVEVRDAQA